MPFGARLRHARERQGISIETIAKQTKILGALLEGLENEDVSRWPAGFYGRAFVRAYATAIGVDADQAVKEFTERFPDPEEAAASSGPKIPPPPAAPPAGAVRVEAPSAGAWFSDGVLVQGFGRRCFAAAVDLFVVCVMGLALYAVLGMFWAPFGLATAAYYCGGILLLGNTPGVCLFADPARRVYFTLPTWRRPASSAS